MVIVKIIGGLGNQMFQYAYAKRLEEKGFDVKIDTTAFTYYVLHGGYQLDKYNIDLKTATKNEIKKFRSCKFLSRIKSKFNILNSKYRKETTLLFDENFLSDIDEKYIEGYFQSENYFYVIRDRLLKQFIIKSEISSYSKNIKNKIIHSDTSVSMHIRRGDYANNQRVSKIHGLCSLDYYTDAMTVLNSKFDKLTYFIFSDDMVWVKENLIINNAHYIDSEEKRIPHEDLYLMSLCDHNIIANSSFSWWGAWLNNHDDKIVISPKKWFMDEKMQKETKDIIPEKWLKI